MPMRQFTVPINCCPERLFLTRPSIHGQAIPAATPYSYESLSQRRVG
jgi:hypothetical protein